MNSVELENGEEESTETFADQLHFVGSPGTDDVNDEPPVCPRIGDQYQVEIPTLATESECLQLRSHPISTDNMLDKSYIFGLGLAIPVTWIHHAGDHIKDEQDEFLGSKIGTDEVGSVDFRSDKESQIDAKCIVMVEFPAENSSSHDIYPQGSACKNELIKPLVDLGKKSGGFTSQGCSAADDQMNVGSPWLHQRKAKGYSPLPGSPAPSWSNTEKQSFLLGLYIFGKDLVQVKKFMEYKKMEDVLSYYYGKFYRSDAYHRWSECRKIRSRKCVLGQCIFTGWRQQELLLRVLPTVSKEGQDTLLEVTKTYNEGRVSLEEFVFTLKAIVGMAVLVESIGIGKGKSDLTGIVLDPVRANQSVSVRPEIPIGKECSSLSSGDIIKFLTGDFRLSKARSNDLFWEAVWPRLLARGWHSEQPKDLSSVVSKHALVFLIPGVKKFSRKKLVKGNHYFDSISDVLNKVASDPRLLDLEVQGGTGSSNIKDENGWAADNTSDQNGLSDHPRHCYLRPRLPNCHSELMKFTVVDTSMVQGEGPIKVRELRSLPVDSTYDLSTCSGEMGSSSSLEQLDSDDSSSDDQGDSNLNTSLDKKLEKSKSCMISKDTQYHPSDNMVAVSNSRMLINGHVPNDQCVDEFSEKLPITDLKCQFSCRAKSDQQNYLTPALKRRRLTACKYERTCCRTYSFLKGHQLKIEEIHYDLHLSNPSHTMDAEVDLSQGKAPVDTSTNHSPDGDSICAFSGENYAAASVSDMPVGEEKPQPRTLIDLNLPHIPTDCETAEPFSTEVAGSLDYLNPEELACPPEKKRQYDRSQIVGMSNGVLDEQPSMNSRRLSTRSRPPTTRALEALACGFLGTKRKGRETRVSLSGNLTSRSSRWMRKTETLVPVPSTSISAVSSDIKEPNSGTNE
ncbi:Arginine-glutamic acid dipeptide repeats protein [Cocos nucifera]|uniref:Arginine-glutamic acid dipeptide repeats protein n=1 Tax=Cocos nucifera TaxID=13894 RepID=A0A8K0N7Z6_COCNU|nr:Arginine-glutamic acid dipeptide repeats protein [Cocos nucifera]